MTDPSRHAAPPDVPLTRDRSFWGMVCTQFLGAFNDNLYKQLMLLLSIPVVITASSLQRDQQDVATIVFSVPFVLFSGFAGFLSDRYSKTRVIVASKVAEIVVMGLGMVAFLAYDRLEYTGLMIVLFLMGMQSSFFGPGKYGVLPELFRSSDLPRANGIILMTTFLAIIFGTVSAGLLGDFLIDDSQPLSASASNLWVGSAICILIAVVGTSTALTIRRVPPARPDLPLRASSFLVPLDTARILLRDRPLVAAILASSMFWLVSGIAIQAVNSLGITQLQLNKTYTSVMTAMIGLGIAVGAVMAGRLCGGKANARVIRIGLWGIVVTLALISISYPIEPSVDTAQSAVVADDLSSEPAKATYRHWLGFRGTLIVLALLGMSAGFFAIPLQVFIQSRPPDEHKGRMIAIMNQANFIAIMLSGFVYGLFSQIVDTMDWPRSPIFGMMAALILPVLLLYRPKFE